jgi:transcriptional regulator with XRE-family HTH domain
MDKSSEDRKQNQQIYSILGNRLKALRTKQRVSQQILAEQIGISHAMVGFLEKGQRGGSDDTLSKMAKYFNIPSNELIELRNICKKGEGEVRTNQPAYYQESDKRDISIALPEHIQEFATLLSNIEENLCKKLIEEWVVTAQKKLYETFRPYEQRELKQLVTSVKHYWSNIIYSAEEVNYSLPFEEVEGYILSSNESRPYFHLSLESDVLQLTLLHGDKANINMFETWISQENFFYYDDILIPNLASRQRCVKFIWFGPTISIRNQYHYVVTKNIDLTDVHCRDAQLEWYLQQYAMQQKSQQSSSF